ncbi:tRNA (adenosine(37)-N6)-dimethylallyltransferase MiaA [Pedobacter sp. BS3]|uniref:tRNA (adenosine(37)-N6)-dimethylallyltransferase MiaA n=1 Tax=Pedobacter sp. BS3 TaxID=2567937 RepID=UPI0011EC9E7C|nr:tRNA (adenosine(37)-N6)-dimethylallyltransferase MiaA [Pedobacter sp. BS3]TZF82768.1 tRNA (adenosine(37)-N6)-dimethylallyltransferase MiaA [Pedobacter sp. BS3]
MNQPPEGTSPKTLIVIAGPTAIGKTELAIKVAQHFRTEIISADSRQFYREMSIGTAKPSPEELKQVKHHFINSHSIYHAFTAGDFEQQALETLANLFISNNTVVLAGGSGLFIDAVCYGFDALPKAPEAIRKELNSIYTQHGLTPLQEELKTNDPEYYAQVDLNNPQRIIRALEVYRTSGRPFSSYRNKQTSKRPFNTIKIALNTDRHLLYERINQRVDLMMQHGLLNEVKNLLPNQSLNALQTVGYTELFRFLNNEISLDTAISQIKQNTRRYAKRQLTWFKRDPSYHWFAPGETEHIITFIESRL